MMKIDCGGATVRCEIGNDGIVRAAWSGLLLPANAGELSARLLRVATEAGGRAVLSDLQGVLLAMPPVNPAYYRWVPAELRSVPIGFLVSGEQAPLYSGLAQAAASIQTMRRAVRSADDGEQWLREQVHALAANEVWWKQWRRQH